MAKSTGFTKMRDDKEDIRSEGRRITKRPPTARELGMMAFEANAVPRLPETSIGSESVLAFIL